MWVSPTLFSLFCISNALTAHDNQKEINFNLWAKGKNKSESVGYFKIRIEQYQSEPVSTDNAVFGGKFLDPCTDLVTYAQNKQ